MATRICRTAARFDPTGVPGPRCCVRRATPPSCTAVVHEISQRDKDAFIFGEGCAGLARRQTGRGHSLPPGPRRAAPPICSDLIYDRHRSVGPITPHSQNAFDRNLTWGKMTVCSLAYSEPVLLSMRNVL